MFEDVTFGIGERPSWLKHFAFCAQSYPLIIASRSSCFLRCRRELSAALSASSPYKAVGGALLITLSADFPGPVNRLLRRRHGAAGDESTHSPSLLQTISTRQAKSRALGST